MEQFIPKSALVAEIEKLKLCTMDEHMNFYSEAAEGEYHALSNLESFLDTLEVKEVDLKKEKVENIKKQCPFREVVCSKYQNHPLKCSGACAFVSDRITLEKKHLHDIQNVPVDEERLKMDMSNTV